MEDSFGGRGERGCDGLIEYVHTGIDGNREQASTFDVKREIMVLSNG